MTSCIDPTAASGSSSSPPSDPARASIYQHPLAYLIGLEGVALMKAFAGEFDREFTEARIAEIRSLLEVGPVIGNGVEVPPIATADGYDGWAPDYDSPENGIFVIEEAYVLPILESLPTGTVIDAACGTGRHSAYLSQLGHTVLGFDTSPGMLAAARNKVAGARFGQADLRALPVRDASADVILCALALAHVEDLGPAFREAARALRSGGRFVISDTRGYFIGSSRYPLVKQESNGTFGYIPTWRHSTVEYLRAAVAHGFRVRNAQEPVRPSATVDVTELPTPVSKPNQPPDVWELHPWAAAAANAAKRDDPVLIIWDFELGYDRE